MTGGVRIDDAVDLGSVCDPQVLCDALGAPSLATAIWVKCEGAGLRAGLKSEVGRVWTPGFDTLDLAARLPATGAAAGDAASDAGLRQEILAALLGSPQAWRFPTLGELQSALNMRVLLVRAAERTRLAFATHAAERPPAYWREDPEFGFVIRDGVSIIDALTHATQPAVSGQCYAFSCYRATEYVIALAIAQELARCHPALLAQLEARWRCRPVRSAEFHEVFLREHGSQSQPLPMRYYVPGDRVWFRNPDPVSAELAGYEGSWVIYLGSGRFANFWQDDRPYSLEDKCLEIYHWRHGLVTDASGEPQMDEARVAACVERSRSDPRAREHILACMQRYREPRGVYTEAGGCIDTTREAPRFVRPGSADLGLALP